MVQRYVIMVRLFIPFAQHEHIILIKVLEYQYSCVNTREFVQLY